MYVSFRPVVHSNFDENACRRRRQWHRKIHLLSRSSSVIPTTTDTKWPCCNRNCFYIYYCYYRSHYIIFIFIYYIIYYTMRTHLLLLLGRYDAHIHPHVMGSVALLEPSKGPVWSLYILLLFFFPEIFFCSLSFGKGHYRRIPSRFGAGGKNNSRPYRCYC